MNKTAHVRAGVIQGLATWALFAAAEIATCTLRPLAMRYHEVVEPSHWYFVIIVLAMYSVAGAVLGGIIGELSRTALQPKVTLTLVSFYLVNLLMERSGWEFADWVALGTALLLFILLAGTLFLKRQLRWMAIAGDPLVAISLLLGAPLLAGSLSFRNGIAFLVAVAVVGVLSGRLLGTEWRQLAAATVAVAAALAGLMTLPRDLSLPGLTATSTSTETKRPNVVLIVLDTVRADHLFLYGYERETTPNLKKFSESATLYLRAMAVSNWTLPSHASMFTALYPRAHGANNYPQGEDFNHALAPKHKTLAEVLTDAGYLSMAIVANTAFVRPDYGLAQGFRMFDIREVAPCLPQKGRYYPRRLVRRLMDQFLTTLEFDRLTRPAAEITADAIHTVEEAARRTGPFFLFVNYMDAHEPYIPPAPFDSAFPGKKRTLTYARYVEMMHQVVAQRRHISDEERAHYVSQYDGAIRYLDSDVARLINRFKELRIYDNSIIVIVGDHGEAFGERDFVSHAQSVYQHQLYVPLLIKYPEQTEPRSDDTLVSHVDLMPTILSAVGLKSPEGLHGRNLLAAQPSAQQIFAEAFIDAELAAFRPKYPARQSAIFKDDLKLIASSSGQNELYDLRQDPLEQHNLYESQRSTAKALEQQLGDWMNRVPLQVQPKRPMDPRALDRLKALGYVQ